MIGAGYIATYHLEILSKLEDVELVAVLDVDLDRARAAAKRHGVPHAVTDLDQLREHAIDVAHVLVPPELHVPVTRGLLERDMGAFVEKPLALHSEEARELARLAEARGLPLGVNHNAVYHPAFARLLEDVRHGKIGRLEHVQITLSVPLRQLDAADYSHWMFREPRNIVFEQGPHPFSQLVELVGAVETLDVTRLGSRELLPGQPFHERWLLAGSGEKATAEVYFAFGRPFTRSSIQVLGSDGFLEADLHHDLLSGETKTPWLDFWNAFLAGWRRGGALRRSAVRTLFYWSRQTLGLGPRNDAFYAGMRASMRGFHHEVKSGLRPRIDAQHGIRVLEWCEQTVRDLPAPRAPKEPSFDGRVSKPGEICVVGANGFIGRRLVRRLLEKGHPVTAVVRRAHALPPILTEGAENGRIRLVRAGLGEGVALDTALRGASTVVHLATGGGDTWADVQRTMVEGSVDLARRARAAGATRFVFVSSTAALYLGRDAARNVDDTRACDPRPAERPPYARGKAATEGALVRLHDELGLGLVVVRPAVVLGAGTPMQHSGLGLWARDNHCVGWGRGTRPVPIVDVDDVADALLRVVEHPGDELDGRALNLASDSRLTAREIIAYLRDRTGRDLHFHPRALELSQLMEIGKWLVKKAGGRKDAEFPSWRDLKSRELWPHLTCRTAREVLGWSPIDDGRRILSRMIAPES